MEFNPILLSGLSLPFLVGVTVTALKRVKLITGGDQSRKAAFITALAYAALWIAIQFYPEAAPAVGTVVAALVSALLAAAGYEAIDQRNGG